MVLPSMGGIEEGKEDKAKDGTVGPLQGALLWINVESRRNGDVLEWGGREKLRGPCVSTKRLNES